MATFVTIVVVSLDQVFPVEGGGIISFVFRLSTAVANFVVQAFASQQPTH